MVCIGEIPGHFLAVDGAQEVRSDPSIKTKWSCVTKIAGHHYVSCSASPQKKLDKMYCEHRAVKTSWLSTILDILMQIPFQKL